MRLLLLFVVVPLVELMLLLKLADITTPLWTFCLVVFTGLLGATLARQQGFGVIRRLQDELRSGQMPTTTLVDALMIFVAGALLITPGILTDLFGFSLLVPAIRRVYRAVVVRWFRSHVQVHSNVQMRGRWTSADGSRTGVFDDWGESEIIDARVIDGQVVDRHDEPTTDADARDPVDRTP